MTELHVPGRIGNRIIECVFMPQFCCYALRAQSAGPAIVKDSAEAGLDPQRLARIPERMKDFVDKGTWPAR